MTPIYLARRPGPLLREDIADILTALSFDMTDEQIEALDAVAVALGLDRGVAPHVVVPWLTASGQTLWQ